MSNKVLNTSAAYDVWKPIWQKCRDFSAGQDKVMKEGEAYLPKIEDQKPDAYTKYLKSGYLYNATGRARQGFVGMVMRKEPDINVPAALQSIVDDIDQEGTSLIEMAEELVREELTVARAGILVDYPDEDTTNLSEAEAEQLNLRPYAVEYKAEDILFVRTDRVQNVSKPVHIRLKETEEVEGDEEFETKQVERVRVLELVSDAEGFEGTYVYRQRVFEKHENEDWDEKGEPYIPKINGEPLNEIPFVFVGNDKFREPHILDLVNANLQHYIQTADYNAGLKWTTRPQPYITGENKDNLIGVDSLGTGSLWIIPNPEAEVGMLEYQGTGLTAVEKKLDKLEEHMATLGARMIAPEKRMSETAEVHTIKRQGENSALSTTSKHVSTALTKVLEWCARWIGASEDVSCILNTDFIPVNMTTQEIKELWQAYLAGAITLDDLLWNLEQGERLDPSMDKEDRKAALETQRPPELPRNGGA